MFLIVVLKILLVSLLLTYNVHISKATTCQSTLSADEFEQQLRHLHIHWPTNAVFGNASIATTINSGHCEIPTDISPVFLNQRSLCPWDVVSDVDENRYPQTLHVARCRCRRCLERYVCEPVLYRIPVLQKRCISDRLEYIKTFTVVSVGCTCSIPKVRTVEKRMHELLRPLFPVVGGTFESFY